MPHHQESLHAATVPAGTTRCPTAAITSAGQVVVSAVGIVLVVALTSPWRWLGLLLMVVGLMMTRVVARVDDRGMTVRMGGFLTVRRIGLEAVASAGAEHVDPGRWGGRGYRMVPGATAVVIRAGEGIVVSLVNGRRFAATVDDAAAGAGLLNGLVARAGSVRVNRRGTMPGRSRRPVGNRGRRSST